MKMCLFKLLIELKGTCVPTDGHFALSKLNSAKILNMAEQTAGSVTSSLCFLWTHCLKKKSDD